MNYLTFLFITKNSDNTTSLYILGGLFGMYMWLSHILKARNAKRQELLDAEEAEMKKQKEIQEQQAILLEEKKLGKPALEIR